MRPREERDDRTVLVPVLATIVVLGFLGFFGCAPPPVTPSSAANCAAGCEHLRSMHCELGRTTPRGATCESVCVTAMQNGSDLASCFKPAQDCSAANACGED